MKKIMFNDKYGLTQAVLEGRKTQTRRIIRPNSLTEYIQYPIGSVVAIAQSYKDVYEYRLASNLSFDLDEYNNAGWSNKMFVMAKHMPHHIKITNVRVERLQDISEEDCIAEGIRAAGGTQDLFKFNGSVLCYLTPKKAYAALIDKVCKKGTWKSNPWVFVYEFKLVD